MKNKNKNLSVILFSVLCLFTVKLSSQNRLEEIFKMQLFLNKDYSYGDSITSAFFSDIISLKYDTLLITSNFKEVNISFFNYIFLKVEQSNIITNQDKGDFEVWCHDSHYYIIAINLKKGVSYRLAGFELNDFRYFYNDFLREYSTWSDQKLKIKDFIKKVKVEGLDFKCLYEGTANLEIDFWKFPCLKKCGDNFIIGWQNSKIKK